MVKGITYTIEAVIGTLLILLGIIIIFPMQQSEKGLSEVGYSCLDYLDKEGLLSYYAVNNMETELNNSLKNCLPSVAEFSLKVCDTANCVGSVPDGKNVYASTYITAGHMSYDSRVINLWTWLK